VILCKKRKLYDLKGGIIVMKKILLAALILTSLSTTAAFASPITTNKPTATTTDSQIEAQLWGGTYVSGWKTGSVSDVTITKNDTIYNDSHLTDEIKDDSFAAKFTMYSSNNDYVSYYPRNVRTLYGSASANDAYLSDSSIYVTYRYVASNGDYEADVTVSYDA
jgi:hypothetical protein